MIDSFRSKALRDLFEKGRTKSIRPDLVALVISRLDALDAAASLHDLRRPALRLHKLRGKPVRYSIWVDVVWRITFEWVDGAARRVDLEQYH